MSEEQDIQIIDFSQDVKKKSKKKKAASKTGNKESFLYQLT